MEQLKVVRSLGELVFDVVLVPRDILRLLGLAFLPWRVHAYIKSEWAKLPDQRFKDGLSPSYFWVLATVLPYFLLIDYYLRAVVERHQWLSSYVDYSWPIRMFVLMMILAGWPMSCALLIRKRSGQARDRDNLKRLFFTHCVAQAPAALILLAILGLAALFQHHARELNGVLLYLYFGLCFYAEAGVAIREVESGWLNRIDAIWSCLARCIAHALFIIIVGGSLVVIGSGQLPPISALDLAEHATP